MVDGSDGTRWRLVVLVVALAGAALRFYAIDFGLPDRHRPDEWYTIEAAARLGRETGFNPRIAAYPAALTYLVSGVGNGAQAMGRERWTTAEPEGRRRWYLTGRLVVALMGALTIPLTATLAAVVASASAAGPRSAAPAGALAAVLLAGAFLHVRDAHFATTDVPMTFWSMAAWLAIAAVVRQGRLRDSLAAGVLIGLATATKYPAITLVLPLVLAEGVDRPAVPRTGPRWRRVGHLAAGLAALGTTFFMATPYVLLDPATTRVAFLGKAEHLTGSGLVSPGSVGWLLGFALPAALGWPLAVLALGSLAWVLVRGGALERVLAIWLVAAALLLIAARMVFLRYLVPLLPVALALVGACLARVWVRGRRAAWAATAMTLMALAPSLGRAVALDRLLGRADTRTLARQWMETHLQPGTIVYSPAVTPWRLLHALPEPSPGTFRYAAARDGAPPGAYVLVAEHVLVHARPPTAALRAQLRGATQLFDLNPVGEAGNPRYELWDAFFVPLAGFAGVERPGPRLRLYRLAQ